MFLAATIESWAGDLGEVSLIYPWAGGSETIMAVAAILAWVAWHFWQIAFEKQEFKNEIDKYGTPENINKAIDDD